MTTPSASNRTGTWWTVRIIPFFIFGAFGFATYVVVPHLCVSYLLRQKKKTGTAVALLVLYFLFFILTLATYLRTFLTIQLNPAFVPFSPEREAIENDKKKKRRRVGDIESQPWIPPDSNPDSPGLEAFYSRDVFVCEMDGRPKWCSDCRAWKPDRAHHSSEMDRCVRKMDHLCPWVGGVVSETSFNFFIQFTFYCSLYCTVCIATAAYSLRLQRRDELSLDGRIIALIALASLFGFFTFAMTLTSLRFVIKNITNIDLLKKNQIFRLAVRVPNNTASTRNFNTVTYPLSSTPWSQKDHQPNDIVPEPPINIDGRSARDQQARRSFAILTTKPGENPWDLGYWRNWKSVMGNDPLQWLLPIRYSPCCNHDSMESDYEFGPLIGELKQIYGLPHTRTSGRDGIEMRNAKAPRS
ncbi:Fc.00g037080.m01.CDS01 [Cosmosporella sp. VM-42]